MAAVYEPDYATIGTSSLSHRFLKNSSVEPAILEDGSIFLDNFRGVVIDDNSPKVTDGIFEFTVNMTSEVNFAVCWAADDVNTYYQYGISCGASSYRHYIAHVKDGGNAAFSNTDFPVYRDFTTGVDHKVKMVVSGQQIQVYIDDALIFDRIVDYPVKEGRFGWSSDGNGSSPDNAPDITIKDVKITYLYDDSDVVYDATSNLLANGDPYAEDLVTEAVFYDTVDASAVMNGDATVTVNEEVKDGERYDFVREFAMSATDNKDFEYVINFPETLNLSTINGKGIIRFWINSSAAGKNISVGLKDASDTTKCVAIVIPEANDWCECQIPLNVIGQNSLDKTNVTAIVFNYNEGKILESNFASEDNFTIAGLSIYSNTAPRLASENVKTVYFAETVAGEDNFNIVTSEEKACSITIDNDATVDGLGVWRINFDKAVDDFTLTIPQKDGYELSDFAPFGKMTFALAANKYLSYTVRITDGEHVFIKEVEADVDWMTYSVLYSELNKAEVDISNIKSIEIFRDKAIREASILYLSPIKFESDYSLAELVFDGSFWIEKEVTYDVTSTVTVTVPVEPQESSKDEETSTEQNTQTDISNNSTTKPAEKINENVLSERLIKLYIDNSSEDMILFSTDTPDVITAGVFKRLREANKGIRYQIIGEDGSVVAFWDITNIAEDAADMKMSLEFISDDEAAISSITKDAKNAYVKTAYNGKMPGNVMLYVGNTFGFDSKNTPKLYTFNGNELKLVDGVVVGLTGDAALVGLGLTEGGEYTLSSYRVKAVSNQQPNKIEQNKGVNSDVVLIVILVLSAILLVVVVVMVVLKKKSKC